VSDVMYPSSQSAAGLGLHAAAAAAAAASLGALPVSMAQQQQTASIYSGATGGGILTTAADARVVSDLDTCGHKTQLRRRWEFGCGLDNSKAKQYRLILPPFRTDI